MSPFEKFYFRCQRSGNCCRVGTGRVWLEPEDVAAMAAHVEMSVAAFTGQYVVQVKGRFSLREKADGSCVLLDGTRECCAYEFRPKQCRDFPNWEYLRQSADHWGMAAGYCPGIQRLPDSAQIRPAFAALKELYSQMECEADLNLDGAGESQDLSGSGCEGETPCLKPAGLRPASSLEVDYFLSKYPANSPQQSQRQPILQSCPALGNQKCTADAHRPLICRRLNPELAARFEKAVQDIAEDSGYPWSRGDWLRILSDRADAWTELTGKQSPLDV